MGSVVDSAVAEPFSEIAADLADASGGDDSAGKGEEKREERGYEGSDDGCGAGDDDASGDESGGFERGGTIATEREQEELPELDSDEEDAFWEDFENRVIEKEAKADGKRGEAASRLRAPRTREAVARRSQRKLREDYMELATSMLGWTVIVAALLGALIYFGYARLALQLVQVRRA